MFLSRAAVETGYSTERIRKMVLAGELDGRKVNGRWWVITREAFEQLKARPKQHKGWPKGKPRRATSIEEARPRKPAG